jgi:succinate-semialdehyde dehydrogenase/glutarate-semialdehyde dehydrogenase
MVSVQSELVKLGSYINGEWVLDTADQNVFEVLDPALNEPIALIPDAGVKETELAVAAAHSALPAWRALPAKKRSKILSRWFELVMQNKHELARLLTLEQGKPLQESIGEIIYGANYIQWFAEEAKRVYGDTIPGPSSDKRIVVIKQPVGVVSAITPWNFPSSMITRKAAPALAAGCTFIVKPSEETPLSAIALAELAKQAGIPAGVFNVVVSTNAVEVGKILTGDSRIAKFSFTGSTPVGKILLKQCAATVKKTTMELGGNAPFIVFDDADIDDAIAGLMESKFRNAGQTCVCSNRIFIQRSIYSEFVSKFVKAVGRLDVGNGMQDGVQIGPVISEKARRDIAQLVDTAIDAGAEVELGAQVLDSKGNFYSPTVLSNVTQDMQISQSEIFGPVAPLIAFDSEEEVIAYANDTEFGLASYVYTRDIGRVWRMSEGLEYGMVGINEGLISNEMAPFGGVKESGMGREGSKYGIDDYLEVKYLCMGGLDS